MFTNKIDPYKLEQTVKNYIKRRLLIKNGKALGDCKVVAALSGMKSIVRLIEFPDNEGIAVRVFPRREKKAYIYYRDSLELLSKLNVHAPRIVDHVSNFARSGLHFISEQYIAGEDLYHTRIDEDRSTKLAVTLAQMHRQKSMKWGPINKPIHRRWFFIKWLKRIHNRVRAVKRAYGEYGVKAQLNDSYFPVVNRFFRSWRSHFGNILSYDLIHDKINPGNVIAGKDGKIYLVDFATLQYGHRAKDLCPVYHELLRNDERLVKAFDEQYFDILGEKEKEASRRVYNFFHAYYHLAECAINAKRSVKKRKNGILEGNDRFNEKALRHWDELIKIVEV